MSDLLDIHHTGAPSDDNGRHPTRRGVLSMGTAVAGCAATATMIPPASNASIEDARSLQAKVAAAIAPSTDWVTLWHHFLDADAKFAAAFSENWGESEVSVEEGAASQEYDEAIDKIVETPAETIQGIAVKLALLRRQEGFAGGWIDDLTESVVRDAERLSGLVLLKGESED